MEIVDFDDLYDAGCQAVLAVKERYDPERGKPFQAFAYKRIRGAMRDLLDEKRKREAEQASPDGFEVAPRDPTEQLVALAEQGELDDSFITEQVALFLRGHETLDDWRAFIRSARFEIVRFFWWFLYQCGDDLDPKVGKAKRVNMMGEATIRYWTLRFEDAVAKGVELIDVSGPQHLEIIERGRKAAKVYPSKLDEKPAGRLLSKDKKKPIDGKTIARWRKAMREAGAPPLMKEDGSFTLKGQEDYDTWNEYFLKISHPRVWRRLQRRGRQDSQ